MANRYRGYLDPILNELFKQSAAASPACNDEKHRLIKFNAAMLRQCGALENAEQMDCSALRALIAEQAALVRAALED